MSESDTEWALRITQYRNEEPIITILDTVRKPKFVPDPSVEIELKSYFLFIQKNESKHKSIRGPADYDTAFEIFEELQVKKDRVAEILLTYQRISSDLDRLRDVAKDHIILKREVLNARSEAVRMAIVARTIPELDDLIANINAIIQSAEILTKNMNKTYDILHTQVDTVKQVMYWRNIALPSTEKSSLKY
jgi:hypothetical protein